MIYKGYKRGETPVYEKNNYRICILLGVLFIVIGLCFITGDVKAVFLDDLDQVPRAEQYGPMIFLACNKPRQKFDIFMQTDDVGQTDVVILWNEAEDTSFEELKLWVVIDDYYESFAWSIVDNALAMDLFSVDGKNYRSSTLGQTNGTDQHIGFLINMKKGMTHTAHFTLQTTEENYIKKSRGKCQLRIPVIMYWKSYTWEYSSPPVHSDDPKWIEKNIMGEKLFVPLMYVNARVSNLESKNSKLILNAVKPTGSYNEYYINWMTKTVLYPQVEYIDLESYNELKFDREIALFFFGMGSSCWVLAIRKKWDLKKNGTNDRKKKAKRICKHM